MMQRNTYLELVTVEAEVFYPGALLFHHEQGFVPHVNGPDDKDIYGRFGLVPGGDEFLDKAIRKIPEDDPRRAQGYGWEILQKIHSFHFKVSAEFTCLNGAGVCGLQSEIEALSEEEVFGDSLPDLIKLTDEMISAKMLDTFTGHDGPKVGHMDIPNVQFVTMWRYTFSPGDGFESDPESSYELIGRVILSLGITSALEKLGILRLPKDIPNSDGEGESTSQACHPETESGSPPVGGPAAA